MLSADDVKGIYCDVYSLYVKYHKMSNSEQMWKMFNNEFAAILSKYQNSRLCLRHLVGVLEQLEEEKGYIYAGGIKKNGKFNESDK